MSPIGHQYVLIITPIFTRSISIQLNYIKITFFALNTLESGADHPNSDTSHKLIGLFACWQVYKMAYFVVSGKW